MTTFLSRPLPWSLMAALAVAAACTNGEISAAPQDPNLFTVARGDLPVTVKENAELQALRETIVRSEVEGQATIIYIVPEGTVVKQGEKLVELDVSELVDKRATQEISVEKATSALAQARTESTILEKELLTKRNTAASQLEIARMELEKLLGAKDGKGSEGKNADMVRRLRDLVSEPKDEPGAAAADAHGSANQGTAPAIAASINPQKYKGLVDKVVTLLDVPGEGDPLQRDMGEMANKILQQADQIRLAMADLKVKEDTVSHSRRLATKKFITRNELERDELAFQSQASKVTIAWNDLELLVNYTLNKDKIKLKQDYENAVLELERVEASNDAERQKMKTDIEAKDREYQVAKERLDNLTRQIKSGVILAPTPGTVVYARMDRNRGGGEAVREGVQVRERQEIIILPDTTKMRCVIKVQEAQVDKVLRGQQAHATIEAFQGEVFSGRVTSVAPVADSNSGWMSSDRKVYTTVVELDSDNPDGRLRSRMAANVTIMVDTLRNTLPVPLQAVYRDRMVNFVWKQTGDGPKAVKVKVGRMNTEKVEALEGVQPGDVLLMTPPAGVTAPNFEQPAVPEAAPLKEPVKPAANGSTDAPGGGDGTRGNRPGRTPGQGGPGGGMRKKFAEMTPEELAEAKSGLDRSQGMIDMARERIGEEKAKELEKTLADLRKALDANDLATAQTHQDALRAAMRSLMGGGRGPGGNNGGNNNGGGAPGSGTEGNGGGEGGGRRGRGN
ncbi:MAG: efflux RND transporter periplasmic adaptor subunit [Planctomycetes bacterium]|nr:efflux RND transporter periplasmic adaptor subunit [Planctomycetota bacterium]